MTRAFFSLGGKRSLPSGLPLAYYQGFQGCVKSVKIFRKRLNLMQGETTAPIQLCSDY